MQGKKLSNSVLFIYGLHNIEWQWWKHSNFEKCNLHAPLKKLSKKPCEYECHLYHLPTPRSHPPVCVSLSPSFPPQNKQLQLMCIFPGFFYIYMWDLKNKNKTTKLKITHKKIRQSFLPCNILRRSYIDYCLFLIAKKHFHCTSIL